MQGATRQKKATRPNIVADDECELYNGSDHRQTIASPLSADRKILDLYQQQYQFDQSHSLAQTKPPLKPSSHRKYYTKSVCTKSTSSTTYVSSDSEEEEDGSEATHACNYGDDGSDIVTQKSSCSFSESPIIGARKREVKSGSSRAIALISNCDTPTSTSSDRTLGHHVTSLVPVGANFSDHVSYDDDDYSVYNLTSDDSCGITLEEDEDSVSDLDKLIQESSSRWKSNTEAVVSRSSTAAFLQGSTTLPSAISKTHSTNHVPTLSRSSLGASRSIEPIGLSQSLRIERLKSSDTEKVIEHQQAEISRLRGMLLARTHQSSALSPFGAMVANSNAVESRSSETKRIVFPQVNDDSRARYVAPFEHIEVRLMNDGNDDAGSCCSNWQDDLTLGSSFNNAVDREQSVDCPPVSRSVSKNTGKSRSRRNRPSVSK